MCAAQNILNIRIAVKLPHGLALAEWFEQMTAGLRTYCVASPEVSVSRYICRYIYCI